MRIDDQGKKRSQPGSSLIFFARDEQQSAQFRRIAYSASEGLPAEHAHHELRYSAPLYRVAPLCLLLLLHPMDVAARYAGPA